MKTLTLFVALAGTAALFTGCVAESKYNDLNAAYRTQAEQITAMEARLAELQSQITLLESAKGDAAAVVAELEAERQRLLDELGRLEGRVQSLMDTPIVVLPTEVDEALREFARQNSGLVEYDASRGVVKFRSDLTFAPGSASLKPEAAATLNQLADVLNGTVARNYEVQVVGHTDTLRIAREATRAQHPTNWHLSAHRAIAVRAALDSGGVAAYRTSIKGYSMYRPVVQNTASGAEANRRVEIYLAPMPRIDTAMFGGAPAGPSASDPPVETDTAGDIPLK